jgi:hypothetical protein
MDDKKVVFVFYTFKDNSKSYSWTYSTLPKGWEWVGSGSTAPIGDKKNKYEFEEQFGGPKITQDKLIKYLDTIFKKLKKNGIIKIYKLRKSYLP